ncbi:hypothetical protein [Pontibacter liquoris]|uniref:hypothetical protein n=1 Tax=Pontibacter liquoris TaxID=2905677 RepID=UPI001FA75229|nr:hypothetical protein [Pontibacter liquoris]
MNVKHLRCLLLTFFAIALLTSCDNEKDKEPSKTAFLVSHAWVGDQVLINNINAALIPGVGSNFESFKSLQLEFRENNTYTSTFSLNGSPQTQEGNWALNAAGDTLTLDMMGKLSVLTLTEENLNLGTTISQDNVQLIARLLGVDPNLISLFTGGNAVKTELRFIKP